MFRHLVLSASLCAAIVLTGSIAQAQFGGLQVQIGGFDNGVRGGFGYGNPYYGNSYYGSSNRVYRSPYYGNSNAYYGNSYSTFGNDFRSYPSPRYYGGGNRYQGSRYQARRYYSVPTQGYSVRRYRGR